MHPSFFPIPDSSLTNFAENFCLDLLAIAKHTLFHRCNKSCKKYNRGLVCNCRFDFPKELVSPPGIIFPEQGVIAVQRTNAYINNHNPYITSACRENNDIKFIFAQKLALAYIYYITNYITKSNINISSSFLICAITMENFLKQASNNFSLNLVDLSRKLITKCLNKIASQTELTGSQVSAYLLGINDHYTPNKFSHIYLYSIEYYLTNEWTKYNHIIIENAHQDLNNQNIIIESFLISISNNNLTAANLCVDYQFRDQFLSNMCIYDYASTVQKISLNTHHLSMLANQSSREGNERVDHFLFEGYKNDLGHPQYKTHIQLHRKLGTERVVVLNGKRIPKKNDSQNAERYGLCILMLFKP